MHIVRGLLTSVLYYLNILQWVVYGFAWAMNRTMKLTGAESLAAAANILWVRPRHR